MVTLWIVCACAAIIAYTYVGYPAIIALLANARPRASHAQGPSFPTVTVCVAAHNAGPVVAAKIESLLAQSYPPDKLDILILSDGSTDGTDDIICHYAARTPRVRMLRAPIRRGKPNAISRLVNAARGEILVMTDVRQKIVPLAVASLVTCLSDPEVGCAAGDLAMSGATGAGGYWRYERWIRRQESKFRSLIGVSGALYAVRKADFPSIPHDIILDDVWIPMRIRMTGKRVVLCAQAVAEDRAQIDAIEHQRKTRTLAGNYQLFGRMPGLLLPFINPSWFETISHRLCRLLCPWALVAMAIASVLGVVSASSQPEVWFFGIALMAQIPAYLLAALGPKAGRAAKLARTFVILNSAVILGLWRYLRRAQRITW